MFEYFLFFVFWKTKTSENGIMWYYITQSTTYFSRVRKHGE